MNLEFEGEETLVCVCVWSLVYEQMKLTSRGSRENKSCIDRLNKQIAFLLVNSC